MKDDTISRQAVLKLLSAIPPEEAMTKAMLIQSVKQMSAAQLGKRTGERTETHACDCISKTAAIDIVEFECGEWRGLAKTIAEGIEQLPSAQPEIIRCRDCKLRDTEYCNMAHGFMGMKDDDYCSYAERREVSE